MCVTCSSNEAVFGAALELTAAVEADGRRVVKREGRPVVMQISGDVKYGFNDRRQVGHPSHPLATPPLSPLAGTVIC